VVSLAIVADHFELSVKDTGTGIPEGELPKVFERFHRVQGAPGRSIEGTGIGLALVRELVRQHAGTVRVDSVLGKGSNFVVSIPRGKSHLAEERVLPTSRPVAAPLGLEPFLLDAAHWGVPRGVNPMPAGAAGVAASSGHRSEARVLVAEDNPDMREYLVRLLESRWTVEAVGNGRQALESAVRRPPDLVLSDAMMPELDGVSLLRALRNSANTSTIPVVILSARAGEDAVVTGLDTGADDYVVKPFSARELLSRVATHLELARLRNTVATAVNELAETRAVLRDELSHRQPAAGPRPH